MKLSIGIVGLPNVGKSTLFNALTKQDITVANYPFATVDPNVGIVGVPDGRLDQLADLSGSEKKIPAVVEFNDIAGLVKGANKGEGLGNQFLSYIREVSVIVHVVRVFESGDVVHVEEDVKPIRDIETINTELILKDLATVDARIVRAEKDAKTGDKAKMKELEILKNAATHLGSGKLMTSFENDALGHSVIQELGLLTAKPQLFLLNGSEEEVSPELKNTIRELGGDYVVADLGKGANLEILIKKAYETLGLISLFTTGEKETRAWTTRRGSRAPQAAGVIHTDFEEKFIRAEVINWEKLVEAGGWSAAKAKGLVRVEGKEYEVKDGDVVLVRHGG